MSIHLSFDASRAAYEISDTLHGLFFEDINFAADGGINANMVNNYSFDGVYYDAKNKCAVEDPLRYWTIVNGTMCSCDENAISEASRFARIQAKTGCRLENLGYNAVDFKDCCAMNIKREMMYCFTCWLRQGSIVVFSEDAAGNRLTEELRFQAGEEWTSVKGEMKALRTAYGKLVVEVESSSCDIDLVEFYCADYWHKGDPKWKYGKLRKDLIEALQALHPKTIRFPGGCIVEGKQRNNEYAWKDTVGELYDRKQKYSLWAERMPGGGYSQSYQIGFYEYFCLCEDLNAKPLPTLFAGLNCQMRTRDKVDTKSDDFRNRVVQDYLDLIEFATGNPEESKWASLRAKMGHPEPFCLDRIGIGNENFGRDYRKKYDIIRNAIHEKYPDIIPVMCGSPVPWKFVMRPAWKHAAKCGYPMYVDDHCYHTPEWFYKNSGMFDAYPRGNAKVYFGEYAANSMMAFKMIDHADSNTFDTALAEAAFLTGIERNGDIVGMTSYAPLFYLEGSGTWNHNLIDFNPSGLCMTANYYVQQLFMNNTGNRYIPYSGSLPKAVYCSASANDQYLYIKIVNAGQEDADFDFTFDHVNDGIHKIMIFHSDDPKAKNRIGFEGNAEYSVRPEEGNIEVKDSKAALRIKAQTVLVIRAEK